MITTYMKNKVAARISCLLFATTLLTPVLTSCQDMLETESNLQVFDPSLDQKTDSMFYTLGILKGVQQAIDQYVLFNEMRGELTATNQYTSTDLRELANFSAGITNKYDSAYIFYRVINNCNYFIQHRDTTLLTGARKVAVPEYVQAYSIRAWAYLQLAKMYGEVPFFTEPITNISEANAIREKKDIRGICAALAPQLKYYADSTALAAVPDYNGGVLVDAGYFNNNTRKQVSVKSIMFPVGLVLGDLYLEAGEFENAAKCYFKYLNDNRLYARDYGTFPNITEDIRRRLPSDWPRSFSYMSWSSMFSSNSHNDVITYVPMAVNKLRGQTTDLPRLFGYDLYTTEATSSASMNMYLVEREIDPSQTYFDLSNAQEYYYTPQQSVMIKSVDFLGDGRRNSTFRHVSKEDSMFYEMRKYENGNIFIYRTSAIYLRLAEALNRMGYPDAAFAILKDGFNDDLETDSTYLTPESHTLLRSTIPFFSAENKAIYANSAGIHSYGAGATEGLFSPYQMDNIAYRKYLELQSQFGADLFPDLIQEREFYDEEGNLIVDDEGNPITLSYVAWTKEALMNAVEDLICDEYALELAFEGHRFGDLCRLARHKNAAATYGSNFGGLWLANKLKKKNPVVDLTDQHNWYLPFGN
ncbi:MAG: RagB/SusD family nutrient uptake outer membrane protein [Prevotella sp.]|nr:RagB/SusD family nutrient uptake outer membrane protein [Prevotella sp.]